MEREYLTIKEFALEMNLHPNTVRRGIKKGKIAAVNIGTGETYSVYRIPFTEISRLLQVDLEHMISDMAARRELIEKFKR